ncbi:MAG: HDIG domain-containing protein [Planctomycetia bacterium]|nr:HDIG domain-containing protein [Planctomycetia bacterium]
MKREDSWALVKEFVKNPSLQRHMRAVEIAMRAYARHLNDDEETWGIVGLLHDFDYERWPDPPDHPLQGSHILQERGYPEEVIYAIKSHADYISDCPRVRPMEKALYACDELCGFLVACALMRPEGFEGMTVSSVKKKMKNKQFAAKVNRDDIIRGAEEFQVPLDDHIQFLITALQPFNHELVVRTDSVTGSESVTAPA